MKLLVLTLLLSSAFFLAGCSDGNFGSNISTKNQIGVSQNKEAKENFYFTEKSFDFGKIKQSGGKVIHDFMFTYKGKDPIEITGVPTSCACTSAKVSPTKFVHGDSGVLTVKFNPNLHEEPKGKFFKTVSFLTEPKLQKPSEVKIWVEIDLDLGAKFFELQSDHSEDEEKEGEALKNYNSITPKKLVEMLKKKDFILVDVHIPEQKRIKGTDLFIPYNEIEKNIDKLPDDKNTKIVLYCRSGGMSRAAAYQLAELGFTNIFDLVGGKNSFDDFISLN